MPFSLQTTRIAWLAAAVNRQRTTITDLMSRMSGLMSKSSLAGMKPAMFHKFMGFLEQVAVAHDEEVRLINRIEDIEAIHRFRRQHGQLQDAREAAPAADALRATASSEVKRPDHTFLWLLGLWYLTTRGGFNSKKQRLTAD